MTQKQQDHIETIVGGTRLSTVYANAENERVREAKVYSIAPSQLSTEDPRVGLLVAAHVKGSKTNQRVRAVAQLNMSADAAFALANELVRWGLWADEETNRIQKQKEPLMQDIVIRDANGAVVLPNHTYVDLAYAACPNGGSMTFAPRTYTVSEAAAGAIGVGKRCKFIGTTRQRGSRIVGGQVIGGGGQIEKTTFEWMPRGEAMEQFFVRNGAGIGTVDGGGETVLDSGVVFENIHFRILRTPSAGAGTLAQRQDKAASPLLIQSGDVGTKTRVDIRNCEFSNAGSGWGMETPQAGQSPDSLMVKISDCYVHDMYDMRNPDGTKPVFANNNQYHSHGYYKSGGILYLANVVFDRIGFIPGSDVYKESKFNQGAYEVGGVTYPQNITFKTISHCGLQVRGATVSGAGFVFEDCPIALQLGHEQNATQLGVPGVGTAVLDNGIIRKPRKFVEGDTGNDTLSCGIWINYVEQVTLSNFVIDGEGGTFGGWAAMNFSVTNQAFINIDGVQIRNWTEGLYFHVPIDGGQSGSAAECNVANLTVRDCPTPWRVGWPNSRQAAQANIGGNWADCDIGGGFDPVALLP